MRLFNYYSKFLITLLALAGAINNFTFAQKKRGAAIPPKAENSRAVQKKCAGGWTGTITYTQTQTVSNNKTTERTSKRGKDTTAFSMKNDYKAQVTISESAAEKGATVGLAAIVSEMNSTEKVLSSEMNLCPGKRQLQEMNGETLSINAMKAEANDVKVSIGIDTNSDGTYRISLTTPEIKGMSNSSRTSKYSGQCRLKEGQNIVSPPAEISLSGKTFGSELQRVNPSEPNRLSGSYTNNYSGVTETITWDLRKCGAASQSFERADESTSNLAFFKRYNSGETIEKDQVNGFLPDAFRKRPESSTSR